MGKNQFIALLSLLGFLVGIACIIATIQALENYAHPLRFIVLFASPGLLFALYLRRKLIQHIVRTVPAELQKGFTHFGVVVGVIGITLWSGTYLNSALSETQTSPEVVENKYYRKAEARSGAHYSIRIKLNAQLQDIACSEVYWNSVEIGDTIPVVYHKSPIGLDYTELPEDD